jgi:hypothetical protein
MSNAFRLHVRTVKPGDFGPSGFAVWSDYPNCEVIKDGAIVEALGPLMTDHGPGEDYRRVRTADGFEGNVIWFPYSIEDGSGFEEVV